MPRHATRPSLLLLAAAMTSACGDDVSSDAAAGTTAVETSTGTTTGTTTTSADDGPNPYDGEPLPLNPDGAWHWIDIDGMHCADGQPSGVGVRAVQGSRKLVLYFKGGGACFNAASCALSAPLQITGLDAIADNPRGILEIDRADNPLADYNIVYLPYCTGDLHSGTVAGATIDGVAETWDFVGHDNVLTALDRVAPTFRDIDQLVVVGTSAGGLGALTHYPQIAEGWPDTPHVVLDDSGLIFRDAYLRPCLQRQMRAAWGLSASLPPCEACENDEGGGLAELFVWLATTYPSTRFGLIGANRDEIIRVFFGFGNDDCADVFGLPDLGAEQLTEALDDLQANVLKGHFASYIVDGETHTWTTTDLFYTASSGGVTMQDWFTDFLVGDVADVAP